MIGRWIRRVWRRRWLGPCVNCGEQGRCMCPACLRLIFLTAIIAQVIHSMFDWVLR